MFAGSFLSLGYFGKGIVFFEMHITIHTWQLYAAQYNVMYYRIRWIVRVRKHKTHCWENVNSYAYKI